MISNPSHTRIVSCIPELDGGHLWVCDTLTGEARQVPVSTAERVTLYPGDDGYFALVHHTRGECVEITAHRIDGDPASPVSRILIRGTAWRFEGHNDVWTHLPRAFLAFYTPERFSEADDHLILVNSVERRAEVRKFPPFYGGDTDKGRVRSLTDVPRQPSILIEQRGDEHPFVLYNYRRGKVSQHLPLSLKPGSARVFRFREKGNELWVSDPDHLVRLQPNLLGDWTVRGSLRLQLMDSTNGRYAGEMAFSPGEACCAVARPFLGDVLIVDVERFEILRRIQLDGMPRSVALLGDGRIFARDWATGRLLRSSLTRQRAAA